MIWDLSECLIKWRNGELSDGEWLNILVEAMAEVSADMLRRETEASEKAFLNAT
jgi:hypothetical protein